MSSLIKFINAKIEFLLRRIIFIRMKRRNIKARKVLIALKRYGCIEKRTTDHGVILENPKNKQSINIPTHRDELAVWIYHNILRRLGINKEEFERDFL